MSRPDLHVTGQGVQHRRNALGERSSIASRQVCAADTATEENITSNHIPTGLIDEDDVTWGVPGRPPHGQSEATKFEDLSVLQRVGMKLGKRVHGNPIHLRRPWCHFVGDAVLPVHPGEEAIPLFQSGTAEDMIEMGMGQQQRLGCPPALLERSLELGPLVRSGHAGVDDDGPIGPIVKDHCVFRKSVECQ